MHTPRNIVQAKRYLKQAFRYQAEGRCFSLVELLSTCPTNWGLTPADAIAWLEKNMAPYFPQGVFKVPEEG